MNHRLQSILGVGGACLLTLATAGCSGSSGTPSSPEPNSFPSSALSAAVVGSVVSVPVGASRAGIRVSVDSPRAETVTDAQGGFRFDAVDSGTRMLRFESSRISAALALSGLAPGSTRTVAVALSESSASESDGEDDCPSNGNGDGCDDGSDDSGDD